MSTFLTHHDTIWNTRNLQIENSVVKPFVHIYLFLVQLSDFLMNNLANIDASFFCIIVWLQLGQLCKKSCNFFKLKWLYSHSLLIINKEFEKSLIISFLLFFNASEYKLQQSHVHRWIHKVYYQLNHNARLKDKIYSRRFGSVLSYYWIVWTVFAIDLFWVQTRLSGSMTFQLHSISSTKSHHILTISILTRDNSHIAIMYEQVLQRHLFWHQYTIMKLKIKCAILSKWVEHFVWDLTRKITAEKL